MAFELETMSLTEIIRLRELISDVLARRFERCLALAFTDVVGSTAYFAEFGDEAGRGLMQRHLDVLQQVLGPHGGRIVDTAGDGAFMCFRLVDRAIAALAEAQQLIASQNEARPPQHHLGVRAGVHWGFVLTDGAVVTGDAVNLCARVMSTAQAGEIRLSKAAFLELSSPLRAGCQTLAPVALKGIPRPVEIMQYRWSSKGPPPTWVTVLETGERIPLPDKPVVTFGRLSEHHGAKANDIVLVLPDPEQQQRISRWHFELRLGGDGAQVTALSDQTTEVDGRRVARGHHAPVHAGSVVRLAGILTLLLQSDEDDDSADEADRHTRMMAAVSVDGVDI